MDILLFILQGFLHITIVVWLILLTFSLILNFKRYSLKFKIIQIFNYILSIALYSFILYVLNGIYISIIPTIFIIFSVNIVSILMVDNYKR